MIREHRVHSLRNSAGFDACDRLTGDYDDVTVQQAVEGHRQ